MSSFLYNIFHIKKSAIMHARLNQADPQTRAAGGWVRLVSIDMKSIKWLYYIMYFYCSLVGWLLTQACLNLLCSYRVPNLSHASHLHITIFTFCSSHWMLSWQYAVYIQRTADLTSVPSTPWLKIRQCLIV